ncbi:Y-family DNA polymerase, partial [Amycolatopsis magusensis]
MLVLWCPDWPMVAACAAEGLPQTQPAAVFSGNRVVACSALARADGVRRGMRRRDAQARCPELVVFGAEPERDARFFESVAAAVEEVVVGVEVVRPGIVAMPVTGAAGYFGGEQRLAELLVDQVAVECQVGVADGLFAATLAAHRSALVDPGKTAEFLAPLDIRELDQPGSDRAELVDLLRRLGLRTLGAFAALTTREVLSR